MLLLTLLLAADLSVARIVSKSPSLTGVSPSEIEWSADSSHLTFLWNDKGMPQPQTWTVDRDGSGLQQTAPLKPNVFLRDGDLWIVQNGKEVQATHIAVPSISAVPLGRYYGPDVEIGGPAWGASLQPAWSPDGHTIAVQYIDRRAVRKFPIPWYLTDDAILNQLRRPAPGDVNEVRTIGLVDVDTLKLKLLDLPETNRMRIIAFGWSPQGELMIDRETDDCVDRVVLLTDAHGTAFREAWHDHGEGRIYNDIASTWSYDGKSILLTGDLDDRYRLFHVRDGKAAMLTPGPSDVDGAAIARPNGIFYVSTAPRPEERHVWFIAAEGGAPRQITHRPGVHTPFVSPDGRTIALLSTDDTTPAELWLLDMATGREKRVTHSPPPEFDKYKWAAARYVQIPSTTAGVPLHARIFVPPTPGRHPVIFGPAYTNRVRNRWDARWGLLEQLLVQRGYIVVALDSRGSTGYGRAFREKFLFGWGQGDLDDYEDAVKWVKKMREADPARIGVFGSSYGGLITVHALFKKPGLFKAGVAGAPAVDPRYYGSDDVAIIRTPAQHPEWFTLGKAARYASGLRDHLMIIHGMADDVVPFQTSVQLAEELIKLGKDFDFVVAPAATHAWAAREDNARYLFEKLIGYFDRYLK